ncbi:MAG TPA: pentapeptide repeat-containing protein [Abditibacteriaceae bacterium]|jgi:pentapeptide MXKDX repeat protein|nr:pentapeptide repeat-containing protein [Abditibacteriaceae bacterium]
MSHTVKKVLLAGLVASVSILPGFAQSKMSDSKMSGSKMSGSKMSGSKMSGSAMSGSKMSGSKMSGSKVSSGGMTSSSMMSGMSAAEKRTYMMMSPAEKALVMKVMKMR